MEVQRVHVMQGTSRSVMTVTLNLHVKVCIHVYTSDTHTHKCLAHMHSVKFKVHCSSSKLITSRGNITEGKQEIYYFVAHCVGGSKARSGQYMPYSSAVGAIYYRYCPAVFNNCLSDPDQKYFFNSTIQQ